MKLVATKFYLTALLDDPLLNDPKGHRIAKGCVAHAIKTSLLIALITIIVLVGKNHSAFRNPLIAGGTVLGLSLALFASKVARILNYPFFITWHMKNTERSFARTQETYGITDRERIALAVLKTRKVVAMQKELGRDFTSKERGEAYASLKDLQLPEEEKEGIRKEYHAAHTTRSSIYSDGTSEKYIKKEVFAVIAAHCFLAITYIVLSSLKMRNLLTNQQFSYALMAPLISSAFLFEAMTRYFTADYDRMLNNRYHQKLKELKKS